MLNNDHFQPDLKELNELNDFDPAITKALLIPSHGAYAKALAAVKEQVHMAWVESLPHDLRRIEVDGCTIALDREREADKPGTVRKPGIRRTVAVTRSKRWSGR